MNGQNTVLTSVAFCGAAVSSAIYLYYSKEKKKLSSSPCNDDDDVSGQKEEDDDDKSETSTSSISSKANIVLEVGHSFMLMFGALQLAILLIVALLYTWLDATISSPLDFPLFLPLFCISGGIMIASYTPLANTRRWRLSGLDGFNEQEDDEDDEDEDGYVEEIGNNMIHPPLSPRANGVFSLAYIDELYEQSRHTDIQQYIQHHRITEDKNIEVLWRFARVCNDLKNATLDVAVAKKLAYEGLNYAQQALVLDDHHAAAHKWVAIMTSSTGDFKPIKEKLAGAFIIRDHIIRSIELDPKDATSRHVLAQWCLAFANMSWMERKAASAFFGTVPNATHIEALEAFIAAEDISPGFWKRNTYMIAETYVALQDVSNARIWIDKAKMIISKNEDDRATDRLINTLASKL